MLRILRIVFLLPRIFTCTRNQKLILAFFFFLVFSFQFRKLFLFKKNPPPSTIGEIQCRWRLVSTSETNTWELQFSWNYETLSVPNGTEPDKRQYIFPLPFFSFFFLSFLRWFERIEASKSQLFLRSVAGVSPQALIDRVPGQLIKFTCIMLDTKWDAWKGAARISLREYISSSVSVAVWLVIPGCVQPEFRSPRFDFYARGGKELAGILFIRGGREAKIRIDPWTPWYTATEGGRGELGERITRMIGTVKWKCNLLVAERSSEFKSSVNALIEKRATNETCSAPTIPSVSIEKHPLLSVAIFRIPIKSAYRAIIGAYLYHRWLISGIIYPSIRLDTTFPLRWSRLRTPSSSISLSILQTFEIRNILVANK